MKRVVRVIRAAPLTTIQDLGRHGMLRHGIGASGPMDRASFARAGRWAGSQGAGGIEFTQTGIDLEIVEGRAALGWDGGAFSASVNGVATEWPGSCVLQAGDRLSIKPGPFGNYGYVRFGSLIDLPALMGSQATSTRSRLGGLEGRALLPGDLITLNGEPGQPMSPETAPPDDGPIRFVWGIHAARFSDAVKQRFVGGEFRISTSLDRMGVRLVDVEKVFGGESILSLISDPILPGDIQILGDGTPVVLMADHQPTGGYPRIGTVITADLGRFAQLRPGSVVAFEPVSVDHAQRVLRSMSL